MEKREIKYRAIVQQYRPNKVAEKIEDLLKPSDMELIPVNQLTSANREFRFGLVVEINKEKGYCVIADNEKEHYCYLETLDEYIGVMDKNNVEIYQNDIATAWSAGSKGTFLIKWRQSGSPCWILYPAWQNREMWSISATKHEKGTTQFISLEGEISTTNKDGYFDDGLEVIGNIYENPELIK